MVRVVGGWVEGITQNYDRDHHHPPYPQPNHPDP